MVRVEPLRERDYERIVEWVGSPAMLTQWGGAAFSYPLTEECLREHYADGGTERRGFRAVEGGRTVGMAELDRIDPGRHSAALARVLVDPAERGRGVGADMVGGVLDVAFDDLGLHRVSLSVFDFNEPALACYESVGFVQEGVRRDSHHHDGDYWSTVVMSVLEGEWCRSGATG